MLSLISTTNSAVDGMILGIVFPIPFNDRNIRFRLAILRKGKRHLHPNKKTGGEYILKSIKYRGNGIGVGTFLRTHLLDYLSAN